MKMAVVYYTYVINVNDDLFNILYGSKQNAKRRNITQHLTTHDAVSFASMLFKRLGGRCTLEESHRDLVKRIAQNVGS